jgi:SDR family mycofactocin-dependent oxidoreductase
MAWRHRLAQQLRADLGGSDSGQLEPKPAPSHESEGDIIMGMLDGKVALITGGGRGQGRAHADLFASEGADIAVCDIDFQFETIPYDMRRDRNLDETARIVEKHGRQCHTALVDVRDGQAVTRFVESTVERFGRLDICVANAGIWAPARAHETTDELWNDTIDTCLTGTFHTLRAVTPTMITQRSGRIIAIASAAARQGTPNLGAYCAAKFGVIGLIKTMAAELGEFGITVNAVAPSFVDTPMINFDSYHRMFRPDLDNPTRETSEEVVRTQHTLPIGSIPPIEISKTILYLASPLSDVVTGTVIDVAAGKNTQWGY